jgi:hypothetical protein
MSALTVRWAADGTLPLARTLPPAERAAARADYLAVSARIGAVRCGGRTLREDCGGELASAWWHHPVSFKDCEDDPAFGRILALRAVARAAAEAGASSLTLVGAPRELARVLRGRFEVELEDAPFRVPEPVWWLRAVASRLAGLGEGLADVLACALAGGPKTAPAGLPALLGYWDWSVDESGDRYLKALPAELAARGAEPVRLCRLEARGGRLASARAAARSGAVLLQSFLDPGDVLEAAFELRPLSAYLRRRGDPDFRAAFAAGGFDLFPLFEESLLRGFLDGGLPRCLLIERATRRALAALRPSRAIHFLEHFPHARAAWAAARAAGVKSACVQHASYGTEKTFLFLDPVLETRGEPDGLGAPVPDRAFAMGALGREHFLACGYAPDSVRALGSPRYDHLRLLPRRAARTGGGVRVLLAPSFDVDAEIPMLEAALAAAEGAGVELRLRDHPAAKLSETAAYAGARARAPLSAGTLASDLAWADVVLFVSSTVAEEAVLAGVPAWQWRPAGPDAAALPEAADIPRFSDAGALRAALASFAPGAGLPDEAGRARVVERLFHAADGAAAARVAAEIVEWAPT